MNTYRAFLLAGLASITPSLSAAPENLTGSWVCIFEDLEFKEELELQQDSHYTSDTDAFGAHMIDKGTWHFDGAKLLLSRQTSIARGKETTARHDFPLNISKITEYSFQMQNKNASGGDSIRNCTKQS